VGPAVGGRTKRKEARGREQRSTSSCVSTNIDHVIVQVEGGFEMTCKIIKFSVVKRNTESTIGLEVL
jgi:hypothetical protein